MKIASCLAGLFIVLASTGEAAERPQDFLGIKWGASKPEARASMEALPGVASLKTKDNNRLEFSGGTFANQPVYRWAMDFVSDQLYRAAVALKPGGDRENQYREFRQMLVGKYGQPTIDRKPGRYPQSIWRFPVDGFNQQSITLTVLMYRDGNHGASTKIVYVCDTVKGAPADDTDSS